MRKRAISVNQNLNTAEAGGLLAFSNHTKGFTLNCPHDDIASYVDYHMQNCDLNVLIIYFYLFYAIYSLASRIKSSAMQFVAFRNFVLE